MASFLKPQIIALACVALFGLTTGANAQTISASDETTTVGGTADVVVTLDTSDTIRGFSFGLVHDDTLVSLESISMGSAIVDVNDGAGPDFYESDVDADGGPGGFVACIIDLQLVNELPAEDDQELAIFEYNGDAVGISDIEFSDDLGLPPVRSVVVSDAESIVPTLVDGSVEVEEDGDEIEFLRGDADNSGNVFAIIDALFILEYGFTNGPTPGCLDAADADGNNNVFPIIDALYVLEYGFTNGPAPPDPGPDECGPDDDADETVTCLETSDLCA